MGLIYLLKELYGTEYNINYFFKNGKVQYQINLNSDNKNSKKELPKKLESIRDLLEKNISIRKISLLTGYNRNFITKVKNGHIPENKHHLAIDDNMIKKIDKYTGYNGWFYDLTTETGTFHAGIGEGHIHNSPRRGTNFVTNKVVKAAVEIKLGMTEKLSLGNLNATRDWGHAKDYVKAMWMILQEEKADDFVCSTGKSHTVLELVEYVFGKLELNWKDYVTQDQKFMRPEELNDLKGDSSKLRHATEWKPEYTFETMLDEMIQYWMDKYC
jgi:hypothetical protein